MSRLPISIMLEPTDNCNLKCWMCPRYFKDDVHQTGIHKSGRFMSLELFEKILIDLGRLEKISLDTIFMHWIGEPFMHPHYLQMIEMIKRRTRTGDLKFKAIETHTNGTLLESGMRDRIFEVIDDSFPWILSFSMDAFSESSYRKIRNGKNIMKVFEAVSAMIKKRMEKKLEWPKIILQFIVQPENYHEADRFRRYWQTFFDARGLKHQVQFKFTHQVERDTIFFRTLDYGTPEEQKKNIELVEDLRNDLGLSRPAGPASIQSPDPTPERLCVCMWQSCAVRWDGTVNFICDIENSMPLGNVSEEGLEQIFFGETANRYRMIQYTGDHHLLEKCRLCGAYLSPNSGQIDEHAKQILMI